VGGIRLAVSQFPEGETEHRVLGRRGGELIELHRFSALTRDGMTLEFTPDSPWLDLTAIRIETRDSPSWVAWREIEVLGVN
jgi:hypothetical protein